MAKKSKKKGAGSKRLRNRTRQPEEDVAMDDVDDFTASRDKVLLENYSTREGDEESEEEPEVVLDHSELESSSEDDDPMRAEAEQQFQEKVRRDMEIEEKISAGWGKKARAYYGADTEDFDLLQREEEQADHEEVEVLRLQQVEAKKFDEDDFDMDLLDEVLADKNTNATTETSTKNGKNKKGSSKKRKSKSEANKTKKTKTKTKKGKTGKKGKKSTDAQVLSEVNVELDAVHLDLGGKSSSTAVHKVRKDISGLSKEEKLDIVLNDAPEIFGLVQEMELKAAEIRDVLEPLIREIKARQLPASDGTSFVSTKMQLMLSYVMNITFLLLLRAEGRAIKNHPVVQHLSQLRAVLDSMAPLDKKLESKITKLVQLAKESRSNGREKSKEIAASADLDIAQDDVTSKSKRSKGKKRKKKKKQHDENEGTPVQTFEEDIFLNLEDGEQNHRRRGKKKKLNSFESTDDYGDISALGREPLGLPKATRKSALAAYNTGKPSATGWNLDDDDFLSGLDYYDSVAKKSKAKRVERAKAHPKPISLLSKKDPNILDDTARREIGKMIMKNRGLTRYRSKAKSNPRKRYRRAFEKATVKRSFKVKDFKGQEHSYSGEAAGIKSTLVKSTKLG